MDIDFTRQSLAFVYSILLGIALGAVYGPFKALRIGAANGRAAVIALDILFMLLCAVSLFFFSLSTLYGYIRIYVILGAVGGFWLYRRTLGRLTSALYTPVLKLLKKFSSCFQEKFKKFIAELLKTSDKILYNISTKISVLRNKRKSLSDDKRVKSNNEKRKKRKKEI